MSLIRMIGKGDMDPIAKNVSYKLTKKKDAVPKIFSPKLNKYVPLNSGNPKGEIQKYNIGLSPGSWY